MSYDANGTPTTENQLVKLIHDTQEYWRFLDNLRYNGYCDVKVERVLNVSDSKKQIEADFDTITAIASEVHDRYNSNPAQPLTTEQLRIAELEKQLKFITDQMKAGSASPDNEDITALSAEYTNLTGEKPDKRWGSDTLKKKIEELGAA